MFVKFLFKKEVEAAVIPVPKTNGDIGMDIHSVEDIVIPNGSTKMIDTGLRLADVKYGLSNKSHALLKIEGRSGLASKGIFPTGGIVDAGYRGIVKVALNNFSGADYHVKVGDRIAQFVVYPVYANGSTEHSVIHVEESHDISDTDRGAKGFGSSGR